MKCLLFGASGGCGSECLIRLLDRGVETTVIVRSEARLPAAAKGHALLTVVVRPDGHLSLSADELIGYVKGVDTVISCLGHTMSRKGIWGHPRKLCTDTTRRVCEAIRLLAKPVKYIVISTEGVDRPDGGDPKLRGVMERFVLRLLYWLLPPHADNMANIKYLGEEVAGGRNPHVAFCAVRPSDMIDAEASAYTTHAELQNGIFNAGTTRRANVGEFMADLATKPEVWEAWKNAYPQLLDAVPPPAKGEGKRV